MTRTPTRLIAAALTALLLAGCSVFGDPAPPTAPPSSATGSTGRVPSRNELRTALLDAAELPGRYVAAPPETSIAAGVGTSMQGCGGSGRPSASAGDSVTAVFQGGPAGPFAAEMLLSAPRASDAAEAMNALRAAPAECGQFAGEGPQGSRISVRLGQLTFPAMGDETVAFRMTATLDGAGFDLYAHVVTVRLGAVLMMMTMLQIGPPDTAATEEAVRAATEKARRVHTP